jgi:hypothetical protein
MGAIDRATDDDLAVPPVNSVVVQDVDNGERPSGGGAGRNIFPCHADRGSVAILMNEQNVRRGGCVVFDKNVCSAMRVGHGCFSTFMKKGGQAVMNVSAYADGRGFIASRKERGKNRKGSCGFPRRMGEAIRSLRLGLHFGLRQSGCHILRSGYGLSNSSAFK